MQSSTGQLSPAEHGRLLAEQRQERIAQVEARHEARWGHLPVEDRPIYAMSVRQAWYYRAWFRRLLTGAAVLVMLVMAIGAPPSMLLTVPLGLWAFYRLQQARKAWFQAIYDQRFADVGTFDTEAAAREAEAAGLPSDVFRMTQNRPGGERPVV